MKYLIFGNGYMGNKFSAALPQGEAVIARGDIGNLHDVARELETHTPSFVINAAGKTGKPNVDWCEDHKLETLHANVTGPLVLAHECVLRGIPLAHIGSGCVYQGGAEIAYRETDIPDPAVIPSYYSKTKAWSERMLSDFPILQIRIRMPLDDEPHERNLLWKITHYERVISVPNSLSVIPDVVSATLRLLQNGEVGIFNVVNPGAITHAEILDMYKEYVDPQFSYTTFSLEELAKITKAGRSNCVLSTDKLAEHGVVLPSIRERLPELLTSYKQRLARI